MTEREYQLLLNTVKKGYPYPSLLTTKEFLERETTLQIVKNLKYLIGTLECPKCKQEILTKYAYCPYCGNKIEKENL